MAVVGEFDGTKLGHNVLYGNPDAGKSTIASAILSELPNQRIAIIDYQDEYAALENQPNIDRFVPTRAERNDDTELIQFLIWALRIIKQGIYDVIVIDEFNQYINNKHETPYILNDLKNNAAHDPWTVKTFLIMRHPAQGDSEFRETANYVITAGTTGKNAKSQLNDIAEGLGDLSQALIGNNDFAVKGPNGQFWVSDPVPEKYTTNKR